MKTIKQSLGFALGAVGYIALVAIFMQNAEKLFNNGKPDSVLAPIAMLTLLVVSVAVMGGLIFGKPVMMYLAGQKKEGIMTAVYTILLLVVFVVIVLASLYLNR